MINDFGEKIGGARKDLWKERGLMVEDLDGMTQGEKEKYVKKDCIWPKEDMKALVADGMPRFVVYFRNEVRKWVHPQPKANRYINMAACLIKKKLNKLTNANTNNRYFAVLPVPVYSSLNVA